MPNENTKRNLGDSQRDQIGKVFAVAVAGCSNVSCAESYSREAPPQSTPRWIAIQLLSFACLNQSDIRSSNVFNFPKNFVPP